MRAVVLLVTNMLLLQILPMPGSCGNTLSIPFPFDHQTSEYRAFDDDESFLVANYNQHYADPHDWHYGRKEVSKLNCSGVMDARRFLLVHEEMNFQDGKKDEPGFPRKSRANYSYTSTNLFYIASGFIFVPAVGSCWIFWRRRQNKVVKLRRNLFIENGGKLLEDMQSSQPTLSVITAKDLEDATNNYDATNILHREREFGVITTCKGTLRGGTIETISIEICRQLDDRDIQAFITKIVTLSHINHKNVVRLVGCCLETQVPILVYQFVTDKTLYDYIHDNVLASSLSWEIRLRIAEETARSLVYMHSDSRVVIIHGWLSSSSILINHGYEVKLRDFALTSPESEVGIQGDVYCFGAVLAELLTGIQAGKELLARYFLSTCSENSLVRILDRRLATNGEIEMLREVAKLAERCLSTSSHDRPTMKEVVTALENAIRTTTICPGSSYDNCV